MDIAKKISLLICNVHRRICCISQKASFQHGYDCGQEPQRLTLKPDFDTKSKQFGCSEPANAILELLSPKDAQPPKSLSSGNNRDRFSTSQLTRSVSCYYYPCSTSGDRKRQANGLPMSRERSWPYSSSVGCCGCMFFDISVHVHPQQQDPASSGMYSLYVTLRVYLLLVARSPAGHRV